MKKPYIDTIRGRAYFVKTFTEDKHGNWDDHWSTIAGEFVIHEGKKHHVYKIGRKYYCPNCGRHVFKNLWQEGAMVCNKCFDNHPNTDWHAEHEKYDD